MDRDDEMGECAWKVFWSEKDGNPRAKEDEDEVQEKTISSLWIDSSRACWPMAAIAVVQRKRVGPPH